MLDFVGAMAHGAVGESQAADGGGAVDGQPNLDGGIFIGRFPAGGKFAGQPRAMALRASTRR